MLYVVVWCKTLERKNGDLQSHKAQRDSLFSDLAQEIQTSFEAIPDSMFADSPAGVLLPVGNGEHSKEEVETALKVMGCKDIRVVEIPDEEEESTVVPGSRADRVKNFKKISEDNNEPFC